jgi:hypothetical protein
MSRLRVLVADCFHEEARQSLDHIASLLVVELLP